MDLSGCQWGSFIIMIWLHVTKWPGLTLWLSSVWWLIETIRLHHAINSSAQTVQTTSGQAGDIAWPSPSQTMMTSILLTSEDHTGTSRLRSISVVLVWSLMAFYWLALNCDQMDTNTALCPDKTHSGSRCLFSIYFIIYQRKDPRSPIPS